MRLDKLLAHMGYGSRKEVKIWIRKGYVLVNGYPMTNDDAKVNEEEDEIFLLDTPIKYQRDLYYLLYKPKGYLSATFDHKEKTVLDLITDYKKGIFPVGRLDKDTTGLLLLTNDGMLAHQLLSPKNHVDKVYEVSFLGEFKESYYSLFEQGIILEDGTQCKPASFSLLSSNKGKITLHEGKYHQVKRMMSSLGLEVVELKRIAFGNLFLPSELKEGEYKILSNDEIITLKQSLKND